MYFSIIFRELLIKCLCGRFLKMDNYFLVSGTFWETKNKFILKKFENKNGVTRFGQGIESSYCKIMDVYIYVLIVYLSNWHIIPWYEQCGV